MVEIISESVGKDGRKIVQVSKENFLSFMKEKKEQGFDHLSLVTAVDRRDSTDLVYHLHSVQRNEYLVVKVNTKDNMMPSVANIWASANWDEREQYDLMGIKFQGHPNLKRMFLPENWVGHPLRKDYDLSKVQYINMDDDGEDYATFDAGDGW
ncbi:MAG: NADH-quinone oxidoreductase subunit C [Candidatus Thermoplasmatota archaeon]|jgi:NADH-quinone oxidoreductase subunit C|nr:NADH-quinone oxidoreductase subunit C [Candidatus Thermoplasmatota archaeon]